MSCCADYNTHSQKTVILIFTALRLKFHSALWGSITMAITLPCLNPWDYLLWGSVEDKVFQKNPYTYHELKFGNQSEIKCIPIVTLTNVLYNYIVHLCNICELWEYHFEHTDMTSWSIGKKEAAMTMQQHGTHVSAATNKHATTQEPWKWCFICVPSQDYREDHQPSWASQSWVVIVVRQ
jgi:hypothetical protein